MARRAGDGGDSRSLADILDKHELTRATVAVALTLPAADHPRLTQMAREGVRYTAEAFQQMAAPRRYATLMATVRELVAH